MTILLLAALAPAPPPAVAAFVARRDACTHWAGEEPYDRARAAQIAAAMRRLRCDRIDGEEAGLRRRDVGNAAALTLLDAAPAD